MQDQHVAKYNNYNIGGYRIYLFFLISFCYSFQKELNLSSFGFRGMSKTIYCTFQLQRNLGMELESVPKQNINLPILEVLLR